MRSGHEIVDADRHVIEPIDMWAERLPARWRHHAPRLVYSDRSETLVQRVARLGATDGTVPLPPELFIGEARAQHQLEEAARICIARQSIQRMHHLRASSHPAGQVGEMDRAGVDLAFLLPTHGLYVTSVDDMDPALSAAFAQAWNNWIHDFVAHAPDRLQPVALMPRHDVDDMVAEVERIASFGWTALTLRPNPVAGRTVGDPALRPFWEAVVHHDLAVAFHEGTHARTRTVSYDRFHSRFGMHACSHPMEAQMAFLSLLEGGVLERHPTLRVGFLEAGAGWLPYWLWRLDHVEWRQLKGEVAGAVRMPPSEYFRRQCWVAVEPDEPGLSLVAECVGADRLLLGTDFPHLDHEDTMLDEILGGSTGLSDDVLPGLLGANARAFYFGPSARR